MFDTHKQNFDATSFNQDSLPPISRWTSLAGIFLVGSGCTMITLSSWVKYNVTIKASGVVRPVGETRLVQSEIESTVKYILVKENQIVKQGDVIANLDIEELLIKQSQVGGNIHQIKLQLVQIDSQILTLGTQILAEKRVINRIVAAAKAELVRSLHEYQIQRINTNTEYLAALTSLDKEDIGLRKAEADLNFAKADRDRYQLLSQTGAVGRREFEEKKLVVEQSKLNLEQEKESINIAQIKLLSTKAAINPTNANVIIAEEHIPQETAQGEASIAVLNKEKESLIQKKVELQTQLKEYQKDLEQLKTQLKKSIIVATSRGIILKLNLRNPGQVVRVSESVAEIAPNDAPLVIKAMIPTSEIRKVNIGQEVKLRVNACPYPDYGTLKGYVKSISPDTVTGEIKNADTAQNTPNSYFQVTIKPESRSFGNSDRKCLIQSGMDASADIISRRETALQYILRKARLISDL
jgi:HlyD family secretion protein